MILSDFFANVTYIVNQMKKKKTYYWCIANLAAEFLGNKYWTHQINTCDYVLF